MARRSALAAALALALLLAGAATATDGSDKARLDARISELKSRAQLATQKEGLLTTELSQIGGRVRAAESSVAAEQAQLSTLEQSLAAERARLASLEERVAEETARLRGLGRQYTAALTVLEKHLRAIYQADSPDLIAFALGTTSFSDLLDHIELLNRIGRQDEQIASKLERARAELSRTRAATDRARKDAARTEALIEAQTAAQRATRDRMLASRDALASAEREKETALGSVREDKHEFLAEAESLAAQSAALAARIAAAQASQSTTGASSGTAPAAGSGQLGWPVAGPVTSGYGWRWGRMHEGIDIAVGTGTPVHAGAAGTVIYSGWMSGYGYLVVIDHGNGLSTASAHNSSLIVGLGAVVQKGFVIALSGNTGRSTGPHVHFEVRVNGAPVDPLGYL